MITIMMHFGGDVGVCELAGEIRHISESSKGEHWVILFHIIKYLTLWFRRKNMLAISKIQAMGMMYVIKWVGCEGTLVASVIATTVRIHVIQQVLMEDN